MLEALRIFQQNLIRQVGRLGAKTYSFIAANFRGQESLDPPALLGIPSDPLLWETWLVEFEGTRAPVLEEVVHLSKQAVITTYGLSLSHWQTHVWFQKLPLPALGSKSIDNSLSEDHRLFFQEEPKDPSANEELVRHIVVNFELPSIDKIDEWLLLLKGQDVIWDPEPGRVFLLRSLGLNVYWLSPESVNNGWLEQSRASDSYLWESLLGLAPLDNHILVIGKAGPEWERSLAEEFREGLSQNDSPIAYLPGWEEMVTNTFDAGLAKAGWLASATIHSKGLVWINSNEPLLDKTVSLFPVQFLRLQAPLVPSEMRAQLKSECLLALAEDRESPPQEELYAWDSGQPAEVAILVSLYNYSERIVDALASILNQSQKHLELIVVDDASTDNGAECVRRWMSYQVSSQNEKFVRFRLIRHLYNSGLATARNTAFQVAHSSWCFVLDADNALFPDAVRTCYELAASGSNDLAVVHPLLLVEAEQGREDDQRSLVGMAPWQRERLMYENTVDAMALVRRAAWEVVGGYTHIEGGWEDYDFWCKLIDAGFHGIQCPNVLAVYRSHNSSMSHISTNRNWLALSRTLQARHPWLKPRLLT